MASHSTWSNYGKGEGDGEGKGKGKGKGKLKEEGKGKNKWNSHYGDGTGDKRYVSSSGEWSQDTRQNWKGSSAYKGKGGEKGTGKHVGKNKGQGKGKNLGGKAGDRGSKPTDDPDFVRLSVGSSLRGKTGSYTIQEYIASGTFSRVYRVSKAPGGRRWGAGAKQEDTSAAETSFAAKVMRAEDHYIQYTSNAQKEGDLLKTLQRQQEEAGQPILTMQCFDSFPIEDDIGNPYICLALEWLQVSLFDVVRSTGNRGLHLSSVSTVLRQLLQQLAVLHANNCTHTDIKHKNCCVADSSHRFEKSSDGVDRAVLLRPDAKLIDYGNATFEGEAKVHPIHTKQFRAPEVLINHKDGWGPASDIWTLGVTAAYLVSGRLLFDSHNAEQIAARMVDALGPFPTEFLAGAKDGRVRKQAEAAAKEGSTPSLKSFLGFGKGSTASQMANDEELCLDLLKRLLALSPTERISAAEALNHPFVFARKSS
mmetsp:Transcript_44763/g.96558  ORF Transcript_44763/g.96558 Transcript_44763/m.96558 type:complete len:479 (-) Transcript_44763:24-1460(-)